MPHEQTVGHLEFKAALKDSIKRLRGTVILLEVLKQKHGTYLSSLLATLHNCSPHAHTKSWPSLIMVVLILAILISYRQSPN